MKCVAIDYLSAFLEIIVNNHPLWQLHLCRIDITLRGMSLRE